MFNTNIKSSAHHDWPKIRNIPIHFGLWEKCLKLEKSWNILSRNKLIISLIGCLRSFFEVKTSFNFSFPRIKVKFRFRVSQSLSEYQYEYNFKINEIQTLNQQQSAIVSICKRF